MAEYDKNGFITELGENEILVFGSNGDGFHGGGAAVIAVQKFGAKMGQAEGLQGRSYAINTMGSEDELYRQIDRFIDFSIRHLNDYKFYVTEIGCGIAGYSPDQIAPHFAYHWHNVVLPESFERAIDKYMKNILKDRKRILCFEYGMGGAMGSNQGGVWFWYVDDDSRLRSWHALASEEFFEFGKTAKDDFPEFSGGMGNFIYVNSEAKYLGSEFGGYGRNFITFEFNNGEYTIRCDSLNLNEVTHGLEKGMKIADCEKREKYIIG